MNHIKKVLLLCGISSLGLLSALGLFLSVQSVPGHSELKAYLIKQLTEVNTVPDKPQEGPSQSGTVIYVLGGSEKSLKKRLEAAAELYHQGLSNRILLFSEPGITEYDPSLGRNLTNDEWSLKQLAGHRVKRKDVEPVSFKKYVFGTFTEAKGLSEISAVRGYKHVILVTSQCHTKRTWVTFSKMFQNRNIALSIYAANDPYRLRSLLYEYLKLVLYKNIVLPYYTEQKPIATSGVAHATFPPADFPAISVVKLLQYANI